MFSGKICNGTTITPAPCPEGHYCEQGTRTPTPCNPGTYNNNTGQSNITACLPCPSGQYCEGSGNVVPDGLCDSGFFCRGGATSARPGDVGSLRASNATNINDTCYNPYECICKSFNDTEGDICPAGYYCERGSKVPAECPQGKYCAHAGLASPTGNCTGGYYCSLKSATPTQHICPSGAFCPEGTPTPQLCPEGTFSNGTHKVDPGDCLKCTAGYFCGMKGLSSVSGICKAR